MSTAFHYLQHLPIKATPLMAATTHGMVAPSMTHRNLLMASFTNGITHVGHSAPRAAPPRTHIILPQHLQIHATPYLWSTLGACSNVLCQSQEWPCWGPRGYGFCDLKPVLVCPNRCLTVIRVKSVDRMSLPDEERNLFRSVVSLSCTVMHLSCKLWFDV